MARESGRKIEGGYRLIAVTHICAAWTAYQQRLIDFRDLRVWFAAHEMVSRRCQMGQGRVAKHTLAELQGLVGGAGGQHLTASLRRLERANLVQWTQSRIHFPDFDAAERCQGMLSQITNRRRRLPVPRRLLRFMTACSRPTLVATLLGYLLRCVYLRDGSFGGDGCCSASWVAQTFGVDLRNVRRAKESLRALGWLQAVPSPHWHRQRWGARAVVNLAWSKTSPTDLPRRSRHSSTILPPPLNRELSSTEISNPKPAKPERGASLKREGKASFHRLTLRDLHDTKRLDGIWKQAVNQKWISPSDADRLNFFAAAERAKRVGKRNPCGLFATVIRNRLWKLLAQEDEDRAMRALRALGGSTSRTRIGSQPSGVTFDAPPDSEPVRDALLRSLASVSHLHGNDFALRQTAPVRPMAGGSPSGANRGQGGTVGEEALRTRGVAP